ncbi:Ig-like domain-containing protein [Anaerosporobacter sp.]|uniref:Ig-like domain-containing protein n=1 Tax=Anaerosporobacter sp. TaxID=1872529 RepID=UPI00286F9F91|nr:Ig-like domain-containing protein [Anaerosporobacter sp.]
MKSINSNQRKKEHVKKSNLTRSSWYLIILVFFLCFSATPFETYTQPIHAKSIVGTTYPFIVLTSYSETLAIGDSFYLTALTSTGKSPTFKSSDSTIASVNTYGKVLAKKAGKVTITAKINGAESSCKVTVKKTSITLNETSISLEHGETFLLKARPSTNSSVKYKSNRKSIATVNENGLITAMKPGEAVITISADGTNVICNVKVKSPQVSLSKTTLSLYRNQTYQLSAKVSSNLTPKWKSNKKSVAIIDETGKITAIKHGTALISATIDGITRTCNVTVESPTITLSSTELSLAVSQTAKLSAVVSSKNTPVWSCSNSNVLDVSKDGKVTALKKGTAYVYVSEDGTKVKCRVTVTDGKK